MCRSWLTLSLLGCASGWDGSRLALIIFDTSVLIPFVGTLLLIAEGRNKVMGTSAFCVLLMAQPDDRRVTTQASDACASQQIRQCPFL